ncbi:unnamed protein product [Prorocentrum cordatum]|uniref:Protein Wnt n=1 Tax=Prorocentrum cordatum TaxID=2364126 RepID=A0ABN9WET0_9DINO|nr:unnamed protein product [Polarella glacialis]
MWEAKLEPNVIFSYSAGISACAKGSRWQRAVALLSEIREAKLEPTIIQLQRWDRRVREGQAVADGLVAAGRGDCGEVATRRIRLQLCDCRSAGWKRCHKVVSVNAGITACTSACNGSLPWRCLASCGCEAGA